MDSLAKENGEAASPTGFARLSRTVVETAASQNVHASRIQRIRDEPEESIIPRRRQRAEDEEADVESPRQVREHDLQDQEH